MRMRMLREHYFTTNGGVTWQPKTSFKSVAHILNNDLQENRWTPYLCHICNTYHVADKSKRRI